MGYTTRFMGEIAITPPIPWASIKGSPFMPEAAASRPGKDVKFRIESFERETPEGSLLVRRAIALVSTWEDEARGYNIVEHVQDAIEAFPEHTFSGRIDAEGEEAGDIWRLKVVDGKATRFEPTITWPEASE